MANLSKEQRRLYDRERNAELKRQGICTQCKKAPAIPGKTKCVECAKKHAEYLKENPRKLTQADLERQKEKYNENAANGICVYCKKNQTKPGRKYCAECIKKITGYNQKRKKDGG